MSMTHATDVLKRENLGQKLAELEEFLSALFHESRPIHEVERGIWKRLLQIGQRSLVQFLALNGTGDLGETVTLPDGEECRRLPELHDAAVTCPSSASSTCNGRSTARCAGQKHAFVPLDNRLLLPESVFSYVLQDWDQALCVRKLSVRSSRRLCGCWS